MQLLAFQTSRIGMPKIGLRRIVQGARIDDVVGADDDRDVRLREVVIDLFHLDHDVVRHARLGEQDVHVARQPARDRMDREAYVGAALAEKLGDVEDRILRLRHRHAVAGHDDDLLRLQQELRGFGCCDRVHFPGRYRPGSRCRPLLPRRIRRE